jgi:hypothetical protein
VITPAILALNAALAALPTDAPLRLITPHGVDIVADEQVFVLFAAMNGAGYAEESARKGPPLLAPVFHPVRNEVRDAIRKVKDQGSVEALKKIFEENPGEIEDYLAAALATEDKGLSPAAAKLRPKLIPALERFHEETELAKVFDGLAEKQRDHAKDLKVRIEKRFGEASTMLGLASLRAPIELTVVPNPLDSSDSIRLVSQGTRKILIVGPGVGGPEHTTLVYALRPIFLDAVKKSYANAKNFKTSWDGIKTVRRIAAAFPDGETYLADALAQATAYRVATKLENKQAKDTDEDFIDAQAKDGQRWARAAVRILDARDTKTGLADDLGKITAKAIP